MGKKRKEQPKEPELPKFGGFNALAAGLGDLKAKLEADAKANQTPVKKGPAPVPPPRPAPPPKTKTSDGDDELTFHRMMSGVTPLENTPRIPPKAKPTIDVRARAQKEAKEVIEHLHHLVDDIARFEVTDDGKYVEGRREGTPPQLVRDLRRGAFPIDGRLDLHGLRPDQAQEKVLEFLRTMRTRGERCVLVIHGKGEGVLRGEISAWLSQGRAREHVAAFATAKGDDGGEGALYVALRR